MNRSKVESWMLRCALVVVALVVANLGAAAAQEVGRYQILNVPLGIEGESEGTTVLLDTRSGRTWYAIVDDKGRPRWRGMELAGGSQSIAEAPEQQMEQARQEENESPAEGEPEEEQQQ
jgi:hypothetical protein